MPLPSKRRQTLASVRRSCPTQVKIWRTIRAASSSISYRAPSARLSRDVAVAERRTGEDAHGARPSPVALSAPTALEHLGPLVFSEHALELQQQAVLRAVSDRAIEKNHLRTGT